MAVVTEGRYAVIMGLDTPALAIPELVGVSGHYRAVLDSA